MELQEKVELVKENEKPVLAAVETAIDKLQEVVDILDKEKEGKVTLNIEEKDRPFYESYRSSIDTYEKLRRKILDHDELTMFDVNLIATCLHLAAARMEAQYRYMKDASVTVEELAKKLQLPIEQDIDSNTIRSS
jgi:hypothetical protein